MKYEKGSFITLPNREKISGLDPNAQCLYIWLCYHANQSGECFPSRKLLAIEAGMSIDSIKRATKKLVDEGIIKKTTRKKGKQNITNIYEIIIGGVGANSTHLGAVSTEGVGAVSTSELNPSSLTQSTEVALKEKMKKFEEEIQKVIYPNEPKGKELEEIKKFFLYWTEPNKSRTKLRWELQPTWDTKRRLGTWFRNSIKFSGQTVDKYKAKMV